MLIVAARAESPKHTHTKVTNRVEYFMAPILFALEPGCQAKNSTRVTVAALAEFEAAKLTVAFHAMVK